MPNEGLKEGRRKVLEYDDRKRPHAVVIGDLADDGRDGEGRGAGDDSVNLVDPPDVARTWVLGRRNLRRTQRKLEDGARNAQGLDVLRPVVAMEGEGEIRAEGNQDSSWVEVL